MAMASKSVLGAFSRAARSAVPAASSSRAAFMSTSVAQVESDVPTGGAYFDFERVKPLKPTHGLHVATLHLRSYETTGLDLYTQFAMQAARNLKIPTSGVASLPTTHELVTVIKSHFVHKKTQENFGRRTHRRAIKVFDADRDVLDLWLRYLKKNGFGGVGMKAYVHEYVEYGFAAGEMKEVEGMLAGPENEVEKAAAEIVKALGGLEFEAPKVEAAKDEPKVEAAKEEPKVEVAEEAAPVEAAETASDAKAAPEPAAETAAESPAEPKA